MLCRFKVFTIGNVALLTGTVTHECIFRIKSDQRLCRKPSIGRREIVLSKLTMESSKIFGLSRIVQQRIIDFHNLARPTIVARDIQRQLCNKLALVRGRHHLRRANFSKRDRLPSRATKKSVDFGHLFRQGQQGIARQIGQYDNSIRFRQLAEQFQQRLVGLANLQSLNLELRIKNTCHHKRLTA